jgi:hypothetical protein
LDIDPFSVIQHDNIPYHLVYAQATILFLDQAVAPLLEISNTT